MQKALKKKNLRLLFCNCKAIIITIQNFDTSNTIKMNNMFSFCILLTSLDIIKLNTRKITNMPGMFNSCYNICSLDIRSFTFSGIKKYR